jgi:hypothetical protein
VIGLSDNGWIDDSLGFEWVKHFHRYIESRITGAYRLLILNRHGSYAIPEFNQFCTENKIITLYMLAYTLHLL